MIKKLSSFILGIFLINLASAQSAFSEISGGVANKIFSGILYFGLASIVVLAIGSVFVMLIYKRRFNIKVKIISRRAKDKNTILFDTAAIMTDKKDGSKYLSLWKAKVKLPIPEFNILQSSDQGDYLEIYRSGEDRFYYLTPSHVDNKRLIEADGKIVPISDQSNRMIDPNMAFWAVKRKHLNKTMFDPETMWMKLIPLLPQIIGTVMLVFVAWIFMKHLPGILSELSTLTKALNQAQTAQIVIG